MPSESGIIGGYLRAVDALQGGAAEVSHRVPVPAAARAAIRFLSAGRDMRTALNLIQPEVDEI